MSKIQQTNVLAFCFVQFVLFPHTHSSSLRAGLPSNPKAVQHGAISRAATGRGVISHAASGEVMLLGGP